ncbi:MAG: hypothetical protein H6677_02385 [Candidatus Obscuribacterales bacterium]|nr:hypothetical protein [Candidatus Obscuribacterales bacterium]
MWKAAEILKGEALAKAQERLGQRVMWRYSRDPERKSEYSSEGSGEAGSARHVAVQQRS